MVFQESDGVRYFTFDGLNHSDVIHAVFTRQGGVSPKPWDSLNMGGFIGDDLQHVTQNRIRSFQTVGRDPNSVYDVWQVHSADVICTDAPRPPEVPYLKADAILTNNPDVTLFMRFADCVPILLFDPVKLVIGVVHAGWQGTVKQIVAHAIYRMMEVYASEAKNIWAGIGPSICAHHYEVGGDVIAAVQRTFGKMAHEVLLSENGSIQFDLWKANRYLLEQTGVKNIEVSGLCTACHTNDWFSHRGENGKTGRFRAVFGLNR